MASRSGFACGGFHFNLNPCERNIENYEMDKNTNSNRCRDRHVALDWNNNNNWLAL
jgi:hypothetical protein